jgi:hypothetical protein
MVTLQYVITVKFRNGYCGAYIHGIVLSHSSCEGQSVLKRIVVKIFLLLILRTSISTNIPIKRLRYSTAASFSGILVFKRDPLSALLRKQNSLLISEVVILRDFRKDGY